MWRLSGLAWLKSIHIAGRWRDLPLRFQQSRLQIDDVVTKLIVLCLNSLEIFTQDLVIPDLFFELLYVALFSLPEGSLEIC
jgi:hypothetical protein